MIEYMPLVTSLLLEEMAPNLIAMALRPSPSKLLVTKKLQRRTKKLVTTGETIPKEASLPQPFEVEYLPPADATNGCPIQSVHPHEERVRGTTSISAVLASSEHCF